MTNRKLHWKSCYEFSLNGWQKSKTVHVNSEDMPFEKEYLLNGILTSFPWSIASNPISQKKIFWLGSQSGGADFKGLKSDGSIISMETKKNCARSNWRMALNQTFNGARQLFEEASELGFPKNQKLTSVLAIGSFRGQEYEEIKLVETMRAMLDSKSINEIFTQNSKYWGVRSKHKSQTKRYLDLVTKFEFFVLFISREKRERQKFQFIFDFVQIR